MARFGTMGVVAWLAACGTGNPDQASDGGAIGIAGDDAAGPTGDDGGGPAGDDAGGPSNCSEFAYCDDFEGYAGMVNDGAALGPWKASLGGTGSVMQVDGAKPYRGSKSLHISVPAGANAHGTLNQKAPAGLIPGNDLFGRAMVFYSDSGGNGLPIGVHSWIFNSAGTSTAAGGGVTMNMGGGGAKLQLNYHPPAPATEQSVQGGMITAGQWHCIQWEYDGSGTPPHNQANVWIDGVLALSVPASKGWSFATPWSSIDFGFTHYQTLMNPVDVYLDEFALDKTKVPCP